MPGEDPREKDDAGDPADALQMLLRAPSRALTVFDDALVTVEEAIEWQRALYSECAKVYVDAAGLPEVKQAEIVASLERQHHFYADAGMAFTIVDEKIRAFFAPLWPKREE